MLYLSYGYVYTSAMVEVDKRINYIIVVAIKIGGIIQQYELNDGKIVESVNINE